MQMTNTYRAHNKYLRRGEGKMSKKQKRRIEIIKALSDLSRDGWRNAKPCDYEALERELGEMK